MKRLFSLVILLCLFFTLCACTKDDPIKPNTNVSADGDGSAPMSEQNPSGGSSENAPISTGVGYIDPNKKINTAVMPTADVDKLQFNQAKLSELKGKTLTLYTPEKNSFFAGSLDESDWFDQIADKYDVNIKYTVRPNNTLFSSQVIAQKSGLRLDLITTFVSNTAQSQSLMQRMVELKGNETNLTFSKRVFDMSGGKVFAGIGNSKMMWYNNGIISDSKAYDYFAKDEWTHLTLDFVVNDARDADKNIIESSNWSAFGSAAGVQVTGITPDGRFVFAPESEAARESFKTFAGILDTVSSKKSNFKNGETAFCYTDEPIIDKGSLGFVPIPGIYGKGSCVTELSGTGIGVSKTVSEENKQCALTFALLWVTRYSEARLDALMHTYGLGAEKTSKYINCAETIGSLYNADSSISSYFSVSQLSDKFYKDPEAIMTEFADGYIKAAALNNRK